MNEIKCPNCGKIFKIDENDYNDIVSQIRTHEYNEELKKSEERIKKEYELKMEKKEGELESKSKDELAKKDKKINDLQSKIDISDKEKELAVNNAVSEKDKKITELQSKINLNEKQKEIDIKDALNEKDKEIGKLQSEIDKSKTEWKLKEQSIRNEYEVKLKGKDEEVAFYKDFKAKESTKMIGENLEQHCEMEFNKVRAVGFPTAYFEKDNDARTGSKGDFIFRDKEDDVEYISIMFEMKNEGDETASKHKNEDFFKELDKDRREKNCEYAVLVTMLEKDNDVYNEGIVDVSYKYPKMYVIRPQFFIPMITILRNAARNNLKDKKALVEARKQNIDIENFENNMNEFKKAFGKNYEIASNKFKTAIEEIDKSISHLQKIKDALTSSENQLRLANNKAEDLSIRKLTKNAPSIREMFEEEK